MALKKIITGAQTGVDLAALHAATHADLHVGGYCTKGGPVENCALSSALIEEIETTQRAIRIENNVIISDGTLILNRGMLTEGTKLSFDFSTQNLT